MNWLFLILLASFLCFVLAITITWVRVKQVDFSDLGLALLTLYFLVHWS